MARTGRPRGFDREAALESAMRVFWQHGYEGASLEALRTAMGGISLASFYAAYRSKEELYREALRRYLASHGQVVASLHDTALSPRERVEQALRASARMQTDPNHPLGCMVTLSATIGSPQNEELRLATAGERHSNRVAIANAVHTAVEDGSLSPAAIEGGLAELLDIAMNGLSLAARDGVSAAGLERAVNAAMKAWDYHCTARLHAEDKRGDFAAR